MLIFDPVLQDEAFPGDLKNNVFSCPEKETKIIIKKNKIIIKNYQSRCLLLIFNKLFERLT